MTKVPATVINEINGACRGHIIAGINGNLPPGWQAYGLRALPFPAIPMTRMVVLCGALEMGAAQWAGGGFRGGARIEVDAAIADHLGIADELAEQLRASIAGFERARNVRSSPVRIALDPGAVLPERKTAGASGYDLCALEACQVQPGRVAVVRTGVHLELPPGTEAQIRPRSGLAKDGLWIHLGTLDADYRGDCSVLALNVGREAYAICAGDRVAQLVFARVSHPEIEVVSVDQMTATDRGDSGFGSTGSASG